MIKNKGNFRSLFYTLFFCFFANAQETPKITNYIRSSLYLDLISLEKDFGDAVAETLKNLPFPDKYNNHNERDVKTTSLYKILQNYAQLDASATVDLDKIFQNYIDESNLENKLISIWFNRHRDGTFNMETVAERGFYNASELEKEVAELTVRGNASLADAGEKLIQNTFVVLGVMYVNGNHKKFAIGSNVRLYKLNWDEEKAVQFYENYWIPKGVFDLKKRRAFEDMSLFKMQYIGSQSHSEVIKVTRQRPILELPNQRYFNERLPRQILDKERFVTIVTRHFDEVYANLQKRYPVFRLVTPLTSVEPLEAQIGMKEGLGGGEKFEVLEQVLDKETGQTILKRKGVINVITGKVWDNRFNAVKLDVSKRKGATQFKGKGDFYPGMLIRQID